MFRTWKRYTDGNLRLMNAVMGTLAHASIPRLSVRSLCADWGIGSDKLFLRAGTSCRMTEGYLLRMIPMIYRFGELGLGHALTEPCFAPQADRGVSCPRRSPDAGPRCCGLRLSPPVLRTTRPHAAGCPPYR